MADAIVKYTNLHAEQNGEKNWKMFTVNEFYAYIAFQIVIGYEKRRKCALARLYTTEPLHRQPIFSTIMAKTRLEAIIRNIRFDERATRQKWISETGDVQQPYAKFLTLSRIIALKLMILRVSYVWTKGWSRAEPNAVSSYS